MHSNKLKKNIYKEPKITNRTINYSRVLSALLFEEWSVIVDDAGW